jgi:hypothetical protein
MLDEVILPNVYKPGKSSCLAADKKTARDHGSSLAIALVSTPAQPTRPHLASFWLAGGKREA